MDREIQRRNYLEAIGWERATVEALPVDASFRCYFRLRRGEKTAILMDAPPDYEDVPLFVRVAEHLRNLGLSTPRILAGDNGNGFLLLEDFGHQTFTRLLAEGHEERHLYQMAVDVLAHLQQAPTVTDVTVDAYDEAMLQREVAYVPEWLWPAHRDEVCPDDIAKAFQEAWRQVFSSIPCLNETLVIRDFHVDNLMLLPGREGIESCGLLDFQGAVIGNPAYDLVSLLEDARRDIPDRLRLEMKARFYEKMAVQNTAYFEANYRVMGAQRHTKIMGLFVRLWRRDGKGHYLKHLPRVAGLLRRHLDSPELGPVRHWFERYLPEFDQPFPREEV